MAVFGSAKRDEGVRRSAIKFNPYKFVLGLLFVLILVFVAFVTVFPEKIINFLIIPLFETYIFEIKMLYSILGDKIVVNIPILKSVLIELQKQIYQIPDEWGNIQYYNIIQITNILKQTGAYPSTVPQYQYLFHFLKINFLFNLFNILAFTPIYLLLFIKAKKEKKYSQIIHQKIKQEYIDMLIKTAKERWENKISMLDEYPEMESSIILGTRYFPGIHNLRDAELYLLIIICEDFSSKELFALYKKFFNNLTETLKVITTLDSFLKKEHIDDINYNIKNIFSKILLNPNKFKLEYVDSTGKKQKISYTKNEINRYKYIPYWIFLMKHARLVRNFPQALITKAIADASGHSIMNTLLKWTVTKNVRDITAEYYFFFDMIHKLEVNEFVENILNHNDELIKKFWNYYNQKKFLI